MCLYTRINESQLSSPHFSVLLVLHFLAAVVPNHCHSLSVFRRPSTKLDQIENGVDRRCLQFSGQERRRRHMAAIAKHRSDNGRKSEMEWEYNLWCTTKLVVRAAIYTPKLKVIGVQRCVHTTYYSECNSNTHTHATYIMYKIVVCIIHPHYSRCYNRHWSYSHSRHGLVLGLSSTLHSITETWRIREMRLGMSWMWMWMCVLDVCRAYV